jgi:hypothetical protein
MHKVRGPMTVSALVTGFLFAGFASFALAGQVSPSVLGKAPTTSAEKIAAAKSKHAAFGVNANAAGGAGPVKPFSSRGTGTFSSTTGPCIANSCSASDGSSCECLDFTGTATTTSLGKGSFEFLITDDTDLNDCFNTGGNALCCPFDGQIFFDNPNASSEAGALVAGNFCVDFDISSVGRVFTWNATYAMLPDSGKFSDAFGAGNFALHDLVDFGKPAIEQTTGNVQSKSGL